MIKIDRLDYLVLTVADIEATGRFYERVMGMEVRTFGEGRTALHFGIHKINLHQTGCEFDPKAAKPTAGSADLCFITTTPLTAVMAHLQACHVSIEEVPVRRTGAQGPVESVYFRDLDGNLIEVSVVA